MYSRPWNLRPDGPNEGQKFANDLTQEMKASHLSGLRVHTTGTVMLPDPPPQTALSAVE